MDIGRLRTSLSGVSALRVRIAASMLAPPAPLPADDEDTPIHVIDPAPLSPLAWHPVPQVLERAAPPPPQDHSGRSSSPSRL
jgi:hypothetical protein